MKSLTYEERNQIAEALRSNMPAANDAHGVSHPRRDSAYERYGKRWIDIAVSLAALVVEVLNV